MSAAEIVGGIKWTYQSDWHEFECDASNLRNAIEAFVAKWHGDRCQDYSPNCISCQQWRHADLLLENPFDKPE